MATPVGSALSPLPNTAPRIGDTFPMTECTLKELRESTGLSLREVLRRMQDVNPRRAPRSHATLVRMEKIGSSTKKTLELYAQAIGKSLVEVLRACSVTEQCHSAIARRDADSRKEAGNDDSGFGGRRA